MKVPLHLPRERFHLIGVSPALLRPAAKVPATRLVSPGSGGFLRSAFESKVYRVA